MKKSTTFQGQKVVEITVGQSRALFSPEIGARLLTWEARGRTIVSWPENADWTKPAKVRGGNPVLFPFIARHFVNGVPDQWQDGEGRIRAMPMHGFCREAHFEVVPDGEDSLRMRLTESATTLEYYPYPFQFDVIYRCGENSLEVEFAVTNTGTEALPYDAGHHFYFNLPHLERADWQLELPFARTGRQNPDGSVVESANNDVSTTLDRPEIIDRYHIEPTNTHFAMKNSKSGATLTFDLGVPGSIPWYAVTTWTQTPESDFFCVEPWLGLPNSIHHQLGLRWLAPGRVERAICRLLAS